MRTFITIIIFCFPVLLAAQSSKNVELASHVTFSERMNDIWGYVAPDQTEYGLVGSQDGTYIFDLSDPANPDEVAFIDGPNSTWRDIKVWDEYAYIVNENTGGLQILDLTGLPDTVTTKSWSGSDSVFFQSAHNIFIDEKGYAYIVGANYGEGGAIIVDLNQAPWNPEVATVYNEEYIHDLFVRGDTMWASEIYRGQFSVVDVSNKAVDSIPPSKILATQQTPNAFTHNVWVSEDNNTIVTTDEVGNGKVAAYDVSDLSNIEQLDLYRSNPGSGVAPHNAFFLDDFVVVSYYRDGLRIVDASRPNNLIETGHYDTSPLSGGGFDGAWGVYPYLPSGLMLVTDIQEGFFVLDPTLTKAAFLEGSVTDSVTSNALNEVDISITGPEKKSTVSDAFGQFESGVANGGDYSITFKKPGYITKTIDSISLANGQTTELSVKLAPLPTYAITGQVIDAGTQQGIPNAVVKATNALGELQTTADANGQFQFNNIYQDTFTFYAGHWGHKSSEGQTEFIANGNVSPTIELERGYADDFFFDLGWQVSGTAISGMWERGNPIGTEFQGQPFAPDSDVLGDLGSKCYITGNGGGAVGNDDVDDGETILESPWIDASNYIEPLLQFSKWFANAGGAGNPNDSLSVIITDGTSEVAVDITTTIDAAPSWETVALSISNFWNKADSFKVRFVTADRPNSGHLVEAGIDKFRILEGATGSAPVAGFYVDKVAGCPPLTTQLTDTSSNGVDNWTWIVTNVESDTFDVPNPTITLADSGTYDIRLIVTNTFGTGDVVKTDVIEVYGKPDVSITKEDASPGMNNGKALANVDGGEQPYEYQWNDSSNQTTDMATGFAPGTYWVTVTDANGCVDSASVDIQVSSGIGGTDHEKNISVGPNPFTDHIQLSGQDASKINDVWMYNVLGQSVPIEIQRQATPVVRFPAEIGSGVYLMRIQFQNGHHQVIKMVKE